jgi:hypothetical protein
LTPVSDVTQTDKSKRKITNALVDVVEGVDGLP